MSTGTPASAHARSTALPTGSSRPAAPRERQFGLARETEHAHAATRVQALASCVREADRLLAGAVVLAGELDATGECEQVEGLPLEQWLILGGRMTGADARTLLRAGRVLADLPVTRCLFEEGRLSWGQVRAITAACRPLPSDLRGRVDERLAATVAQSPQGTAAFDPDGLVWAVDAAVEELRHDKVAATERRAQERSFLARQLGLDGRMRCYGEFDPVSAAALNNAIDAKLRPLLPGSSTAHGGDAGTTDPSGADGSTAASAEAAPEATDGGGPQWQSGSAGRAAAQALVEVCAEWLGGDTGRPARPLVVAHVDISQATAHPCGTVELNLRGHVPRIATATLERLSNDADMRAVLFEGRRPLAVSAKLNLAKVPAKLRLAVQARDGGDRFPGSPDPVGFADLDHVVERARGGVHHPDLLVAVSRRFHTLRHRHGWRLRLNPSTGMLTILRGERRFHSMPRTAQLARTDPEHLGDAAGARGQPDPPDPGPPS